MIFNVCKLSPLAAVLRRELEAVDRSLFDLELRLDNAIGRNAREKLWRRLRLQNLGHLEGSRDGF